MTVTVPSRIPWPLHRVATSGYYPDGLHVIATQWTLEQLYDAWLICDAFDAARLPPAGRGDG